MGVDADGVHRARASRFTEADLQMEGSRSSRHRRLGATRFSVFNGGISPDEAGAAGDAEKAAGYRGTSGLEGERRTSFHEECYACPVGGVFARIRQASGAYGAVRPDITNQMAEPLGHLIESLSEVVRAGAKLLEVLAERAGASPKSDARETVERIPVE